MATAKTVKRKFFYYKARVENETTTFTDMLRKVGELGDAERACEHAGQQVMLEVTKEDDHFKGKVGILREDGIPTIGTRDTLTSRQIDLLENEGIQEVSHFIFLPAKSLLAFEYNHYGPRVTLLFKVVNEIYDKHFTSSGAAPSTAAFDYVAKDGAFDRIDHAGGIKAVEATITNAQLITTSNTGLLETVRQIGDIGQTKTIGIFLKGEKGSRSPIMTVAELIRKFLPNREQSLPDYDKFRVKVINSVGTVEMVDLFEDKVVSEINIIKLGRNRALDSGDLYKKVLEDVRSKANGLG